MRTLMPMARMLEQMARMLEQMMRILEQMMHILEQLARMLEQLVRMLEQLVHMMKQLVRMLEQMTHMPEQMRSSELGHRTKTGSSGQQSIQELPGRKRRPEKSTLRSERTSKIVSVSSTRLASMLVPECMIVSSKITRLL